MCAWRKLLNCKWRVGALSRGKVKEIFERVEMGERTTRPGWGKHGAEDLVPREAKGWNNETQTGDTDHRS